MRGAGRIGGKNWKVPPSKQRGKGYDLFEIPTVEDLPVAPTLEPINDDWSISNFNEPVDPRDCSKYPASPHCGENPFRFGHPVGFDYEIRTNGCETCVYIYPVVAWMKLTPTIICYRNPNCNRRPNPPNNRQQTPSPPIIPDGHYLSVGFVRAYSQQGFGEVTKIQGESTEIRDKYLANGFLNIQSGEIYFFNFAISYETVEIEGVRYSQQSTGFSAETEKEYEILAKRILSITTGDFNTGGGGTAANPISNPFWSDWYWKIDFMLVERKTGKRVKPAPIIPPPPPPPENYDDKRKKKMCCNECSEAAELSRKILKILGTGDIAESVRNALNAAVGIGKPKTITDGIGILTSRLGADRYPIEVPESLLTGVGDKVQNVQSITDYLYWLTHQIDALIGEFPVKIKIKDIDPLTAGDQEETVIIPNIAEMLAELYGLTVKNSINQEVELNMLIRLAAEVVATKNGVAVTQDYARANAQFLGYKGNPTARALSYNFDFANADFSGEKDFVLESLLTTVVGSIEGWKNDDKETLVDYLKRLMFAAGIVKAAFFRNKKQVDETAKGIKDMFASERDNKEKWNKFIQAIRDPNSQYNKDYPEKPDIKNWFIDPNEL